jgi:NADP-dependent 3-hydroxy acid dehydrogenase YdfG
MAYRSIFPAAWPWSPAPPAAWARSSPVRWQPAGAGVVLAARRVERLKTLRAEIEAAGGDAHVVKLDVTDPDSIKAAVAHAETEMGTIDILVNNSGVSTTQKLVDVTPTTSTT